MHKRLPLIIFFICIFSLPLGISTMNNTAQNTTDNLMATPMTKTENTSNNLSNSKNNQTTNTTNTQIIENMTAEDLLYPTNNVLSFILGVIFSVFLYQFVSKGFKLFTLSMGFFLSGLILGYYTLTNYSIEHFLAYISAILILCGVVIAVTSNKYIGYFVYSNDSRLAQWYENKPLRRWILTILLISLFFYLYSGGNIVNLIKPLFIPGVIGVLTFLLAFCYLKMNEPDIPVHRKTPPEEGNDEIHVVHHKDKKQDPLSPQNFFGMNKGKPKQKQHAFFGDISEKKSKSKQHALHGEMKGKKGKKPFNPKDFI